MCTMKSSDQDFTSDFELVASPDLAAPSACHTVALWFDTAFSVRHCAEHPVVLSTAPGATPTHWAQTLLTLRAPVALWPEGKALPEGAGGAGAPGGAAATASKIQGRLSMVRSEKQYRSVDIALEYSAVLSDGSTVRDTQLFHMSITSPS